MTDFVENLKTNHTVHGIVLGGGVYYLMNKNGSEKALKYGALTGIGSIIYMNYFNHQNPFTLGGENVLTGFNQGLAQLFGS
mgnify:CR=1 FL=1